MRTTTLTVDSHGAGRRLDQFLADLSAATSRSEVQRDIHAGNVFVSGEMTCQPSRRLREGDVVVWNAADRASVTPQRIPLRILYEDDALVAVDKPRGLVVHPGAGTRSPTLVEGLLSGRELPQSDDPSRPGIVHRLDKETSGVILVAKTPAALQDLQRQFAARSVQKSYIAVVGGTIREQEGAIDAPIGRDPAAPRRMSVQPRGRTAQTEFRVLRRLEDSTLLLAHPCTGRTHQIRVHFRYIGHPVLGDTIYGTPSPRERAQAAPAARGRSLLPRQAQAGGPVYGGASADRLLLHAWRIAVRHPETEEVLHLEAPVPPEFPNYPYDEIPWADGADPS